jgi:hypothetical protein
MRHIKARRRFRVVLSALLLLCAIVFFESRIEAFAPQLKSFAVLKIEDTFNGKLKLSIGSLDGGILHPFVLNDIKIKDEHGKSLFSSLNISSMRTNYRIWDVLLRRGGGSIVSKILERDSRVYINFVSKDKKISGFVRLDGDLENSNLKGYVIIPDVRRIEFSGIVKQDRFELAIRLEKGFIKAEGSIAEDGSLDVNFKISHVVIFGCDIVCDANLTNKIAGESSSRYLDGIFEAKNLVLNYDPFLDLKVLYRVEKGVFTVSELSLSDIFKGCGNIALKEPFDTDFTLTANNVNLLWLFSKLGAKEAAEILKGTMNAKFELKGPIANLRSNTQLEVRKGMMGKLDFDYLNIALKGDGPIVRIEDSRIVRESGYFALSGEMDLRRMGKTTLFSNIKMAGDDRAINWDGLESRRVQDFKELSLRKRVSDEIDVNFKQFTNDDKVGESIRDSDDVQLDYKLHSNNSLKMAVSQDRDFFGFEHKDKF